jgi:hypothetical protein
MRTSSHAQAALIFHKFLVPPHGIELCTSPLPTECSQRAHSPNVIAQS